MKVFLKKQIKDLTFMGGTTLFAVVLGFVSGFELESFTQGPLVIPVLVLVVSACAWMLDPYCSHHKDPTRKTTLIHYSKWFSMLVWSFLMSHGLLLWYHDGIYGALKELAFCGMVGSGISCVVLFALYWIVPESRTAPSADQAHAE